MFSFFKYAGLNKLDDIEYSDDDVEINIKIAPDETNDKQDAEASAEANDSNELKQDAEANRKPINKPDDEDIKYDIVMTGASVKEAIDTVNEDKNNKVKSKVIEEAVVIDFIRSFPYIVIN